MTTKKEVCLGCDAINYIASRNVVGIEAIATIRSDHEFAKHAQQISMFDTYEISAVPISWTGEDANQGIMEAFAARREGEDKADKGATEEFKEAARYAIMRCANSMFQFIVDDVWLEMPEHLHYRNPEIEGRWMGPRMSVAKDLIMNTRRKQTSANKNSHASDVAIWQSHLIENPALLGVREHIWNREDVKR